MLLQGAGQQCPATTRALARLNSMMAQALLSTPDRMFHASTPADDGTKEVDKYASAAGKATACDDW